MVEDDMISDIAQAFTHFTHLESEHKEMVCDIQGVIENEDNQKWFTLSDPVIHQNNGDFDQRTNRMEKGFAEFYKSHVCGKCCRLLGLEDLDRQTKLVLFVGKKATIMMKKSGRHHEKRFKEVSNQIKKLGVSHSSAKFSKDVEVIVYEPMTELLSKTQRNQLQSSRNEGVFCVQVDDINEYLRLFEAERKKREEDAAKKEKVEKAAQRGKQIVGQRGQQIAGRRKKKTKQKKTTDGLVNILNDRLLFPNDGPKDRVEMLERIFLGGEKCIWPLSPPHTSNSSLRSSQLTACLGQTLSPFSLTAWTTVPRRWRGSTLPFRGAA